MIYHIIERDEIAAFKASGTYHPESLDREGFIHCSPDEASVLAVANNFYPYGDILVLEIDEGSLGQALRWETSAHDIFAGNFPHLYGELEMWAVRGIRSLDVDAHGTFRGFSEHSMAKGDRS